ncbi:MAG: carbon storage regulator [Candidatus Paceibacterota bacterium]|jgi:carbon storage regulator CsrA
MLVLSRKLNQSIVIDGQIFVKILDIDRYVVKLGIHAPAQTSAPREEFLELNESTLIDGQIVVKIVCIDRRTVKLGVQAPAEVPVDREEVHERKIRERTGQEAINRNKPARDGLVKCPFTGALG